MIREYSLSFLLRVFLHLSRDRRRNTLLFNCVFYHHHFPTGSGGDVSILLLLRESSRCRHVSTVRTLSLFYIFFLTVADVARATHGNCSYRRSALLIKEKAHHGTAGRNQRCYLDAYSALLSIVCVHAHATHPTSCAMPKHFR